MSEKPRGHSSFQTGSHKVILNELNSKSKTNRKRTNMTIRINHNRSIALERSVINYWELEPVLRSSNLTLGSAVVHTHIEVVRSA